MGQDGSCGSTELARVEGDKAGRDKVGWTRPSGRQWGHMGQGGWGQAERVCAQSAWAGVGRALTSGSSRRPSCSVPQSELAPWTVGRMAWLFHRTQCSSLPRSTSETLRGDPSEWWPALRRVLLGWGFSQPPKQEASDLGGNEKPQEGGLSAASASGALLPGGLTLGPAHFVWERLSQRQD